jgi:hypothetical protein
MFFVASWVAAIAGAHVLEEVKHLATSPISAVMVLAACLLTLFGTLVIVFMALYRLDGLATRFMDGLEGKKWRFKYLNVGYCRSLWLVDKNSYCGFGKLGYHGFSIGFFTDLKFSEGFVSASNSNQYAQYRIWRLAVSWTKQH